MLRHARMPRHRTPTWRSTSCTCAISRSATPARRRRIVASTSRSPTSARTACATCVRWPRPASPTCTCCRCSTSRPSPSRVASRRRSRTPRPTAMRSRPRRWRWLRATASTGVTTRSTTPRPRAATPATPPMAQCASANSARWCRRCTGSACGWAWTWSTTTPAPRARPPIRCWTGSCRGITSAWTRRAGWRRRPAAPTRRPSTG